MKRAFLFDLNKCVACEACVVACINENKSVLPIRWRSVSTFNPIAHPDLPVFYYSIACNHCDDAPCMKNCPANAYERDAETGAVIHYSERCIGCKYCTWNCPYDAPKFNKLTGVVEKCNFCVDRLKEGLKPACAQNCPVGALDYTLMEEGEEVQEPGFICKGIGPSIKMIPLHKKTGPELSNAFELERNGEDFRDALERPKDKIQLKEELPLFFFSLISLFMVSIKSAEFFKWQWMSGIFGSEKTYQLFFLLSGILAVLLSTLHLGKKQRAYRSVLNIRKSWLSREILFFGLFYFTSLLSFFFMDRLHVFSLIFGGLCLLSVDKVYKPVDYPSKINLRPGNTLVLALLMFVYLADLRLFIVALSLFAILIFADALSLKLETEKPQALRLLLKTILIFFLFAGVLINKKIEPLTFFILLTLLSIERISFYMNLQLIFPKLELVKTLKNELYN